MPDDTPHARIRIRYVHTARVDGLISQGERVLSFSMIEVHVTRTVGCSPEELLEFVMDPERYARVDSKICAIDWVRRDGDTTEFRFRSKLPGLPGQGSKIVSRMTRTPGKRVDVRLPPIPANRLANLVSEFSASWTCVPADGGTTVTRTVRCGFRGPLKWVMEPALNRALEPDIEDEIAHAKAYLEATE